MALGRQGTRRHECLPYGDRARVSGLFLASGSESERWLNHLRIMVQPSDYWQTGENLWVEQSGIITDARDNLGPRGVEQQRF